MKIAISQPRYLPAANYIQRVLLSDVFVLLDCVQHQPRAFEHRNKIKSPNGPVWLSMSLQREHHRQTIKDLKVDGSGWKENHIKTIEGSYKRAKFYHGDFLKAIYTFDQENLVDINESMLRQILLFLGIERKIIRSSSLKINWEHDKKLAEIVRSLGGDTYISGPNGRNYIDRNNFGDIEVLYHDFFYPKYEQLWGDFVPWMAFIDILFNVGTEEFMKILRCNYELTRE